MFIKIVKFRYRLLGKLLCEVVIYNEKNVFYGQNNFIMDFRKYVIGIWRRCENFSVN